MGLDYRAVLMLGKTGFESESDIKEFLDDNGFKFSEEDETYIRIYGIDEFFYYESGSGLKVICLDNYSGDNYCIGFYLDFRSVQDFNDSLQIGRNAWVELFPNVEPEMFNEVCVY